MNKNEVRRVISAWEGPITSLPYVPHQETPVVLIQAPIKKEEVVPDWMDITRPIIKRCGRLNLYGDKEDRCLKALQDGTSVLDTARQVRTRIATVIKVAIKNDVEGVRFGDKEKTRISKDNITQMIKESTRKSVAEKLKISVCSLREITNWEVRE